MFQDCQALVQGAPDYGEVRRRGGLRMVRLRGRAVRVLQQDIGREAPAHRLRVHVKKPIGGV